VLPIVDISDTSMAASGTTKKVTTNQILQAGGTATLASATITGDLTVDTSTLKVDSTNNRVGIGTATPVSSLQVLDGDITVTTGGSFCGFNGTRQTIPTSVGTQLSRLHFSAYSTGTTYAQGASIQSYSAAAWSASSSPATLSFYTTPSASVTPSERMKIEAAGDVTISTGNVVMATSGKGIDFSATTSGSGTMTSELLNDYEEGTWTIGLKFGGASVGLTTSANTGRYTKVGRQVNVTGYIQLTNKGTSVGAATITGLPFGVANNAESYAPTTLRLNGVSYTGAVQAYAANTSPTISLEQLSILGAITDITDSNFTNASAVMFNVTYTVA
jgi:hypothetical protein